MRTHAQPYAAACAGVRVSRSIPPHASSFMPNLLPNCVIPIDRSRCCAVSITPPRVVPLLRCRWSSAARATCSSCTRWTWQLRTLKRCRWAGRHACARAGMQQAASATSSSRAPGTAGRCGMPHVRAATPRARGPLPAKSIQDGADAKPQLGKAWSMMSIPRRASMPLHLSLTPPYRAALHCRTPSG